MTKYPLSEIVKIFENPEIQGDASVELSAISSLEKAKPGDLSFLGNKKYSPEVPKTKASAILLPRSYKGEVPEGATIVRVDDPSMELAKLCAIIEKQLWPAPKPSVHPTASVDESAKIGKGVFIGANVIVCEGAEIGDGVVLQGNAVFAVQTTATRFHLPFMTVSIPVESDRLGFFNVSFQYFVNSLLFALARSA